MVWLVGWFRRRKRERLQSAWDSEWGEVDGKQWEFTNAEGLVQQWEHNVGGDIPVSKEQLDAFRELLSAWEAHSRAPQDGGPVRGFREPGSEDSVLQVSCSYVRFSVGREGVECRDLYVLKRRALRLTVLNCVAIRSVAYLINGRQNLPRSCRFPSSN